MSDQSTDVAIVGAGPYGLSIAAQLRARGVSFRIFGPPMKFWRDMPPGLNLKSLAFATSIYVPERGHTFPEWCRQRKLEDYEPCTMQSFATYGMWMKDRFVPDLEPAEVTDVSPAPRGFLVSSGADRSFEARRVVFATGLSYLSHVPEVLRGLPAPLSMHTFDLTDYSVYRGKEVVVVGGGASAIEAGALVHEAGGSAQVLVRDKTAVFHTRSARNRPLLERLRAPMTVLGAGRKHVLLQELPLAVHFLPEARRVRLVRKYLGPAAPWWIRDRIDGKVPIHVSTQVVAAREERGRLRLDVQAGDGRLRVIEADHVIAGTGFDLDLARLPYLSVAFRDRLRQTAKAPALSMYFESSVRGMYFVGPASAMSFGPLFRFVAGAEFAAPMVARHIAGPLHEAKTIARSWRAALSRTLPL